MDNLKVRSCDGFFDILFGEMTHIRLTTEEAELLAKEITVRLFEDSKPLSLPELEAFFADLRKRI